MIGASQALAAGGAAGRRHDCFWNQVPRTTNAVMSATKAISPPDIDSMSWAIMTFMLETSPPSVPLSELPAPVVLGLGANEGEPRLQLARALGEVSAQLSTVIRVSSLYTSAPVGPSQPDFFNCAALLSFAGDLRDLLKLTQRIEAQLGRVRKERWGPRSIDIDLLWAGSREVCEASLVVPHPELERRAFALLPLLELVPHAKCPHALRPYGDALATLHWQRIHKSAPIGWERSSTFEPGEWARGSQNSVDS